MMLITNSKFEYNEIENGDKLHNDYIRLQMEQVVHFIEMMDIHILVV